MKQIEVKMIHIMNVVLENILLLLVYFGFKSEDREDVRSSGEIVAHGHHVGELSELLWPSHSRHDRSQHSERTAL